MRKKFFLDTHGFTLIELLIVIAILGVLAAVVLVAINPLEQLKRGRDASRISGTSQLGDAMIHYATVQNTATYPAAVGGWQTSILVAGNELNLVSTAPNPIVACGAATNQDNGYCYAPLNASADFAIWVILESGLEANKVSCVSPAVTASVYFGSKGKVQIDCLPNAASIPNTTDTLVNP